MKKRLLRWSQIKSQSWSEINLIGHQMCMEKPDLRSRFSTPIKLISDQLCDLIGDISVTISPSRISDRTCTKSPIKLMAEYLPIKSDDWRLNVAMCSSLLIHIRNIEFTSPVRTAAHAITTDQFILRIVFCEEIKWIDAPEFTIKRIFDLGRYGWYRWYHCYDDAYWLRRPLTVHAG